MTARKKIWILNHYATNMFFDKGGRHHYFAKYLGDAGYDVTIICASTVHNSNANALIDEAEIFSESVSDSVKYVFIRTRAYGDSGFKRALNMLDYYRGLKKTIVSFEKPDVIIGSSVHPLACVSAIQLSHEFECKNIVEIRDLWPEAIVSFGSMSNKNPITNGLYALEKWIYARADSLIFTMEGGAQYIRDKRWDTQHGGPVSLDKVHSINNGIDIEFFDRNRTENEFQHEALDNNAKLKVVYAGSIRKLNNVKFIVEAAECLKSERDVDFLLFGEGPYLPELKEYRDRNNLENVKFFGQVEKKFIPSILSKADITLMNYQVAPVWKYGGSQNKQFDYFAAGKPVCSNLDNPYSLIERYECGIEHSFSSPQELADSIIHLLRNPDKCHALGASARKAALAYDFKTSLTPQLISVIEE